MRNVRHSFHPLVRHISTHQCLVSCFLNPPILTLTYLLFCQYVPPERYSWPYQPTLQVLKLTAACGKLRMRWLRCIITSGLPYVLINLCASWPRRKLILFKLCLTPMNTNHSVNWTKFRSENSSTTPLDARPHDTIQALSRRASFLSRDYGISHAVPARTTSAKCIWLELQGVYARCLSPLQRGSKKPLVCTNAALDRCSRFSTKLQAYRELSDSLPPLSFAND